jgi:hypothetical protein
MPIAALETALYSTLTGTAALITELGGTFIYNQQAPQNPADKYVIFNQQGGGDINDTPIRERNVLYSVFGIALTQEAAFAIDTKIDAALHLATLTITGWSNLWLARETDVNFTELDSGGVTRYRAGAIYRVIMDKSS